MARATGGGEQKQIVAVDTCLEALSCVNNAAGGRCPSAKASVNVGRDCAPGVNAWKHDLRLSARVHAVLAGEYLFKAQYSTHTD